MGPLVSCVTNNGATTNRLASRRSSVGDRQGWIILPLRDYSVSTAEGLWEALQRGSQAYVAAEILVEGPEQRLPPGMSFVDKSGRERHEVRLRWRDPGAMTFKRAAVGINES
jgi:hypothetical protein